MEPDSGFLRGRVVRAESGRFLVSDGTRRVPCTLRGRIRKERLGRKRNVVVGDEVRVRLIGPAGSPADEGVIEELLPRRNLLSRRSAGRGRQEQVLMANLDRLFLVMALREPAFQGGLLDRFLVASEQRRLPAWICLNKCDLARAPEPGALLRPYRAAGYPTLELSALEGLGLEDLREAMRGRVSLFLGPSGTGKSTLLNRLQPGLEAAVAGVQADGRGRHTTTRTELHALDFGGWLADSPGVREFGLWGLSERELGECFPEFRKYLGNCRFHNCSHSHEPGCAILAAREAGELDPGRHDSYRRLLADLRAGDTLF